MKNPKIRSIFVKTDISASFVRVQVRMYGQIAQNFSKIIIFIDFRPKNWFRNVDFMDSATILV